MTGSGLDQPSAPASSVSLDTAMGTHISRDDEESIQRIVAAAQPPSPELVEFLSGILGPTHQRLVERRRRDQATGPARDAA